MKQLPAGWRNITAEEYCLKVADGTHDSPKPTDEGFFLATSKNIKNGILDLSSAYKISSSDFEQINKRSKVDKRDILFSMIGTVGEVCLLNMQPNFAIKNVGLFKCGEKEKSQYLYYYLKSPFAYHYVISRLNGTTQKYITLGDLRYLPIHLPPLPEQQAIAAVLSSFDDKIELLRAENQTLEQMGQELFKERFGKWKVGDDLPEGWRVGKITEIIRRESISYKCDKKDLDDKGLTPILDQGSTGLYGYTSRDPDFIATKDSPVIIFTNHTCNFWFIDYPFCAIQNVLPYRGINGYDEYFLYFMTKGSIKFTEYKGHRPSFVALDFIIPPVELAKEFSRIAERILKKISWNKQQIQSLSATRDQLLPKLMSGEVRVEF